MSKEAEDNLAKASNIFYEFGKELRKVTNRFNEELKKNAGDDKKVPV